MATTTEHDHDEVVGSTPDERREQALRQLRKKRDLKAHAAVYVLFNLTIWGIWVAIGAGSGSWWPWPIFVTLGWGIGLVMNAWDVYFRRPISEEDVQREMRHLERPQ